MLFSSETVFQSFLLFLLDVGSCSAAYKLRAVRAEVMYLAEVSQQM